MILSFPQKLNTVETVLSGPVLSSHPLLSGQFSKSRKLPPLITVILACIKRSSLLSGRGHPSLIPDELFLGTGKIWTGPMDLWTIGLFFGPFFGPFF